ncbi:DUF927 domain-containing protein [Roseomonas chloroacetimidivorans]|uniref:DUF927 domain-containing protein n=1 Tax=Roseomonas chloroacetimidivorans TaxID=1766656 RepID=UPI003C776E81
MDSRMDPDGVPPDDAGASETEGGTSRAEMALELVRLAGLSEAEYQAERKHVAAALKLNLTALDKLVKAERNRRRQEEAAASRRKAPPAPGQVRWPPGFTMKHGDGLYADAGEQGLIWLCAPLEVLGGARDAAGEGWSLLLRWKDDDHRTHTWPMPKRLLVTQPGELEAALLERGLRLSPHPNARLYLREALSGVQAGSRVSLVGRAGWHIAGERIAYVMADGTTYGGGGEEVVLTTSDAGAAARLAACGTLEGWREGVAAPAIGNHRLALFIAASLAPPLLEIIGAEGGGVHLLGGSSTGKTTCLEGAASAWGSPRMGQQVRSWRSTANALEGAAVECSDGLLALDEIGLADGKDVGVTMYTLAGGAGRGRADRSGALRTPRTWRTLFLSTGEISPADKIGETGQRSRAGQDVRCVSIPALAGGGHGVWQDLHGHPSGEALSNAVKAAALAHHGHAARAFLAALVKMRAERPVELLNGLREAVAAFTRGKHVPTGADGQVRRVAQRFGLIAAAGDLAAEIGILPWPDGESERAAVACFSAWLAARGGHGAAETQTALQAVRAFIGAHGSSRFATLIMSSGEQGGLEEDTSRPVINRAGWRRQSGSGWEYLVLPDAWKDEVCRGLDADQVARELGDRGLLMRDGKNLRVKVSIPNEGRPRLYVVRPGLLEGT